SSPFLMEWVYRNVFNGGNTSTTASNGAQYPKPKCSGLTSLLLTITMVAKTGNAAHCTKKP
ncbi:hypothetical protein KDA00_05780, partial [Candidatus Saccharibacteria bacterium]|nr:hypothetical protein [Candidatus Saccharibacteria bacterium]